MRIVFFGCDDFALVSLRRLVDDGVEVAALVTRPDRPQGRGLHTVASSTKVEAQARGLTVLQPEQPGDPGARDRLGALAADVFVVVSYGKLLPDAVLALPRCGCVNVHPSLLPKYRGAAPVNWAVINGDTETGVTLIRMSPAMDGGDILAQERCVLPPQITAAALREDLAVRGADLLARTLPRVVAGTCPGVPQDSAQATRAPKLTRELGMIDWTWPAGRLHNLVRGVQPWPGAVTRHEGAVLKILAASLKPGRALSSDESNNGRPGVYLGLDGDAMKVSTGDGVLWLHRVQPASGKPMTARAYAAGRRLVPGAVLGGGGPD